MPHKKFTMLSPLLAQILIPAVLSAPQNDAYNMFANLMQDRITEATFHSIPGQTCGVSNSEDRIVNGAAAENPDQLPWMARFEGCWSPGSAVPVDDPSVGLVSWEAGCRVCGATMISPYFLLTSAKCVFEDHKYKDHALHMTGTGFMSGPVEASLSSVRLGSISNADDANLDAEHAHSLSSIFFNSDFDGFATDDIALLKTVGEIGISASVYPICLPPNNWCLYEDSEVWISGYGHKNLELDYSEEYSEGVSDYGESVAELNYAKTHILKESVCQSYAAGTGDFGNTEYNMAYNILDKFDYYNSEYMAVDQMTDRAKQTTFCAGENTGETTLNNAPSPPFTSYYETTLFLNETVGACTGDQGIPLVAMYNHAWYVFGIATITNNCGRWSTYSLYTRVNAQLAWIVKGGVGNKSTFKN